MRIVELDRNLVGKRAPIVVAASKPAYNIGQRARDEKVLLHEPQSLAQAGRIVGIEHPRQCFGRELLRERAHEIAVAEFLKVKVVRRGGAPQSKGFDGSAAISNYRKVARDAEQPGRLPNL